MSRLEGGRLLAALALALGLAGLPEAAPGLPEDAAEAPLWDWIDPALTGQLEAKISELGLAEAVEQRKLGVALVDLSEPDRWPVAALNGDELFYSASLPKIAVMLAVFEKSEAGELDLDDQVRTELEGMIRRSSNPDSTALMNRVGKPEIAEILESPRYRLYDPEHGGGLWVGKDYAKTGLWRRDPIANLSHAATPMQVARFFTLLHAGALVNPEASLEMKRLLAGSEIRHKFVRGLEDANPDAVVYRKSGTWRHYHADSALVQDPELTYVAVGLARDPEGGQWLERLAVGLDAVITDRRKAESSR